MRMPEIESSDIKKCQAITDLIESIALMETALSHILNAEGEKIQAAVGTLDKDGKKTDPTPTPSIPDLIKVNNSVEEVVSTITLLEAFLRKKLALALDVDCKDKDKPQ